MAKFKLSFGVLYKSGDAWVPLVDERLQTIVEVPDDTISRDLLSEMKAKLEGNDVESKKIEDVRRLTEQYGQVVNATDAFGMILAKIMRRFIADPSRAAAEFHQFKS